MKVFIKIVNSFSFLTIFAKSSILDVWQDSDFLCKPIKNLRQKDSHLDMPRYSYNNIIIALIINIIMLEFLYPRFIHPTAQLSFYLS